MKELPARPRLILLDVYETLLDMSEMEYRVNALFHNKKAFALWFELLMEHCFADNQTGTFHSFHDISRATMEMMAARFEQTIDPGTQDEMLQLMKHLPLHEGVQQGLSELNDAGFRLAALTNSSKSIVNERMERTGLVSYFEKVFSAEDIKKYKPSIEVYHWAARKLGLPPGEVMVVSTHGWDIAGAANAGMQTAWISNRNELLYPLTPVPRFVAKDLENLAGQLIAAYSETTT